MSQKARTGTGRRYHLLHGAAEQLPAPPPAKSEPEEEEGAAAGGGGMELEDARAREDGGAEDAAQEAEEGLPGLSTSVLELSQHLDVLVQVLHCVYEDLKLDVLTASDRVLGAMAATLYSMARPRI